MQFLWEKEIHFFFIFTGSVTSTRTVDSFCNFCVKIFIRIENAQARYICTGNYMRQKEQCYLPLGCKEASIPIKISYGILNITVPQGTCSYGYISFTDSIYCPLYNSQGTMQD